MQKTWKVHRNTVYWVNLEIVQRKGLTFYQTLSNAIILHNTLPPRCIEKVVLLKKRRSIVRPSVQITFYQTSSNAIIFHNTLPPCSIGKVEIRKAREVPYNQVYKSPLSPPKITLEPAWKERRIDTSNLEAGELSVDSSGPEDLSQG